MFIKNEQYEILLRIRDLLPEGETFINLPKEDQEAIVKFESLLLEYRKEQRDRNTKIAAYVAEKRKTDKNFGRTPYVKKATDMMVCVGKKDGYDIYRKVYFDGSHYYIRWNNQQIIVDEDVQNKRYTRK